MINYVGIGSINMSIDGAGGPVNMNATGYQLKHDDSWHWEGQSDFPDTVGRFEWLIPARNIGVVFTPFRNSRASVPGEEGTALVTQISQDVSVAANLTVEGTIRLASKMLNLLVRHYRSIPGGGCPPALAMAAEASEAALTEARL